jgi:hypothetical protein
MKLSEASIRDRRDLRQELNSARQPMAEAFAQAGSYN